MGRLTTTALVALIILNFSLILSYTTWISNTDFTYQHIPSRKSWTVRNSYNLSELNEGETPLLRVQAKDSVKDMREERLIAEMKQCSLALGMTKDELKTSMRNLTIVVGKVQSFLDALHSIIPSNYTRDLKNPCWQSNQIATDILRAAPVLGVRSVKRLFRLARGLFRVSTSSSNLYCLPYFFIAGFPKSGTTTLHKALQQHPEITRPTTKEPHWWTRVPLEDMNADYLKLTAIEYLLYFSKAAEKLATESSPKGTITYDGSQSTLWGSNFFLDNEDYCAMPAAVSKILPNAKFIVVMRNPVTREYSNFFYTCGSNPNTWPENVRRDPALMFHQAVTTDITAFNNCLTITNNSLHKCVRWVRSVKCGCGTGHIGKRLPIGLYYFHLHKWLQFFPREKFLFLRTEDMCRQPHRTMTRITRFLGVEQVSKEQAKEWLCHQANSQNVYLSNPEKFEMRDETKQVLEGFYEPFNVKLAELIGSERFLWTDKN